MAARAPRLYRAVLHLFPAAFRAEYGAEMSADFAARRHRAGGLGVGLLWLDTLIDVVHNAARVHTDLLRQDVRFAVRSLRRAPGFTLTAILLSSLGVAATTATFSVTNHVLLRPLPFRDPGRLVQLWEDTSHRGGGWNELSPPEYREWKREAQSFSAMGGYFPKTFTLAASGSPERVQAAVLTADVLPLLGREPLLGRAFNAADDRDAATQTVLLSYQLWQQRFAGERTILGRKVLLDDAPYEVIGVMPPDFRFPQAETRLWVPLRFTPDNFTEWTNTYISDVARLRPGVSVEAARAEMGAVAARIAAVRPGMASIGARVVGIREDRLTRQSRLLLLALCGAAFAVLMIACTNLGSLLLGRTLARQRELAVRSALGGARERLLRQLVTESALLALLGGIAGVLVARAALPVLGKLVPNALPFAGGPTLDARVLAIALVATGCTVFLFAVLPALRSCRALDAGALRGSRGAIGDGRERLRAGLVVAEVTVSIVLLVGCALLLRALWRVQSTDPGFRAENVLTLRTELPFPRYGKVASRVAFYHRVLDETRALPGVTHAAYTSFLPIVTGGGIWGVVLDGEPRTGDTARRVSLRFVTPDYFSTLGIPLRRGRDVAESDTAKTAQVAVISAALARQCWPGADPIGRRFYIPVDEKTFLEKTVVGVVGDVHTRGLERTAEPQVYLPYQQIEDDWLLWYAPKDLAARTNGSPAQLAASLRRIVTAADPTVPIADLRPLAEVVTGDTAPRALQARVLTLFAAVAFLLAGIGLHGLLAFMVGARSRELGVRVALGASRREILALVVGHSARLALAGVALGALLALVAARSLQSLLFGVSPHDPLAFAAAIGLALLMAVVGTLPPVLRALRLEPQSVLRLE